MDRRKAVDPRHTQPERAFWRDVFIASLSSLLSEQVQSEPMAVQAAADLADAAVQEYRTRILWRDRK